MKTYPILTALRFWIPFVGSAPENKIQPIRKNTPYKVAASQL